MWSRGVLTCHTLLGVACPARVPQFEVVVRVTAGDVRVQDLAVLARSRTGLLGSIQQL